jgi:glyoxylase-like metal-dependent hydrolase (beta-lactamase superfamily II)
MTFSSTGWYAPQIKRELRHGDVIDLGNRHFQIKKMLGAQPGGIVLYDPVRRELFAGCLLLPICGSGFFPIVCPVQYAISLRELLELDIWTVYPGQGSTWNGFYFKQLIRHYLRKPKIAAVNS